MPLQIKPHTAQVHPTRLSSTDKGELLPVDYVPMGPTLACQIAPISSERAFGVFGVELKDGYRLLCEVEDGGGLVFGTVIWWPQGKLWLKVLAAQDNLVSPLTQHTQVLLSKMQLRAGAPK